MMVREYGEAGPHVFLLHGGPGAPGYLAPLARDLAHNFQVLEPFQRRSGAAPLTVAHHVADLQEVIQDYCGGTPALLIGHSWGAMLALAYAARLPQTVKALALIGCGTFDEQSRKEMHRRIDQRMDSETKRQIDELEAAVPEPDERLKRIGQLLEPVYSVDLIDHGDEAATCDQRGHDESWEDMKRLQHEGVYPGAFSAIPCPTILFHGADDPHPGRMIRDNLQAHMPQLEYREYDQCGHYPWWERHARETFLSELTTWLQRRAG